METIVITNGVGKVRREKRNGRDYFVVPMTLLPGEGVLAGSQGAGFYPADESRKSAPDWDGMPIVVDHPTLNGTPVSARDPDVSGSREIGRVYRTSYSDKLAAEGWFDVADTLRVDKRVHDALTAGKQIELSTGLGLRKDPAPAGATHNGTPYDWIARDYRPDHVAVLPDKIGACSVKDGCGVLVNESQKRTLWQKLGDLLGLTAATNEVSHEELRGQLQKALKSQYTQDMPHCWVGEVFDDYFVYMMGDETYRQGYTKSDAGVTLTGDPVEVVRQVSYVPASGPEESGEPAGEGMGAMSMNRAQTIEWLVANCDCWKDGKADLEKMPDGRLAALKAGTEKAAEAVANAAKLVPVAPAVPELVTRKELDALTATITALNASVQSLAAAGEAQKEASRKAMIDLLVNGLDEAQKAARTPILQAMTTDGLALMLADKGISVPSPMALNYLGAAGGAAFAAADVGPDDVMDLDAEREKFDPVLIGRKKSA